MPPEGSSDIIGFFKAPNNPIGVANADQDRGDNNQVGGENAQAPNEQNVDQVVPASKLPTIDLDAAKGILYFHHGCVPPIIHCDVNSNNILLDDEFGTKISNFGMVKVVKAAIKNGVESIAVFAGSYGYIAPGIPLSKLCHWI
ncbi:hypothetical protein BC332_30578 [Capsicum chinense]|nr:hypothetical protein BC332_30578 [Capsicum chinense]